MKTFETRRKLRTQRDISARQHDRVSRDLETAQTRIDELGKEVKEAWTVAGAWKDQHDRILEELKKTRKTAAANSAGHARTIAQLSEYATILDGYGWTPPENDPADKPADAKPDANVEEFPSVYLEVAKDHKEQHPEVDGKTTSWHKLTPEQEQQLKGELPPVEAWDAFTTSTPLVPAKAKPRRRVPAARKPAES